MHGEIVLKQPFQAHVLTLLLFAIIVALAVWIFLGQYSRTETVRGLLVTSSPSAKIRAGLTGTVARLNVSEGRKVKAGQVLAIVRLEQDDERGASAISQGLHSIDAQQRFSRAQVQSADQRADSERRRLKAMLGGYRQQRSDLLRQIALQEETVRSSEGIFRKLAPAAEKGFVSQFELERRRQESLAVRRDLLQLRQQQSNLEATERQAVADLSRVEADRAASVNGLQADAEALAHQSTKLRSDRAYAIKSPIDGIVTALQASVGQLVDAQIPLMIIVPDNSVLQAELYAPTRAIGFIRNDQQVRLLYDAFPYQRFGSFSGKVESVSRVVIDPTELRVPLKLEEPVNRIRVRLRAQSTAASDGRLPLQPGMTLTANIVLERRSFGGWLLQPLNAVLNRNN